MPAQSESPPEGLAEETAEALMVCVNPCGTKVLNYGVTCMLEAMEELSAEQRA